MRSPGTVKGQSIVEMAFMLPILLVVIFGIIEFGWLIFAYSTISQAARNGAEAAAQLPPYQSWLDYEASPPAVADYPGLRGDPCTNAIYAAIETDTTILGGSSNEGRDVADYVEISYPVADTRNLDDRGPIEVMINYPVRGLTPLWSFIGLEDGITMRVTQRRSLENLGNDPTRIRGIACAEDMASWRELTAIP